MYGSVVDSVVDDMYGSVVDACMAPLWMHVWLRCGWLRCALNQPKCFWNFKAFYSKIYSIFVLGTSCSPTPALYNGLFWNLKHLGHLITPKPLSASQASSQ